MSCAGSARMYPRPSVVHTCVETVLDVQHCSFSQINLQILSVLHSFWVGNEWLQFREFGKTAASGGGNGCFRYKTKLASLWQMQPVRTLKARIWQNLSYAVSIWFYWQNISKTLRGQTMQRTPKMVGLRCKRQVSGTMNRTWPSREGGQMVLSCCWPKCTRVNDHASAKFGNRQTFFISPFRKYLG